MNQYSLLFIFILSSTVRFPATTKIFSHFRTVQSIITYGFSWNPFFSFCRVCSPSIGIVEVGFVKLLKHSPSFLTDSTRSYSIVCFKIAFSTECGDALQTGTSLSTIHDTHTLPSSLRRHKHQAQLTIQTPSTTNNPNTRTLPSIAIKINDDIPKILCMQCSAVYFIFNSLVYVHINYKIDKKTSVNPYLYFNLWTDATRLVKGLACETTKEVVLVWNLQPVASSTIHSVSCHLAIPLFIGLLRNDDIIRAKLKGT